MLGPPFSMVKIATLTTPDCLICLFTELRTADELVQMIAHFYYNAKRPSCVNPEAIAPPC